MVPLYFACMWEYGKKRVHLPFSVASERQSEKAKAWKNVGLAISNITKITSFNTSEEHQYAEGHDFSGVKGKVRDIITFFCRLLIIIKNKITQSFLHTLGPNHVCSFVVYLDKCWGAKHDSYHPPRIRFRYFAGDLTEASEPCGIAIVNYTPNAIGEISLDVRSFTGLAKGDWFFHSSNIVPYCFSKANTAVFSKLLGRTPSSSSTP